MTEYVVGFMFSPSQDKVALIRKNRPAWQAGRLNGVGGHVEVGEEPVDAMAREFHEECGVATPADEWTPFARLTCATGDVVHFFRAVFPVTLTAIGSPTDEDVEVVEVASLASRPDVIFNLRWLVPMAVNHLHDREHVELFDVMELPRTQGGA